MSALFTLFPPLPEDFNFQVTKRFGYDDSGALAQGIELGANPPDAWDWSNDFLVLILQPAALAFVQAGSQLPEPLPPLLSKEDALVIVPKPDAMERLFNLFRTSNQVIPLAFIYENVKLLYNNSQHPNDWPELLRDWYNGDEPRLLDSREGLEGLRVIPDDAQGPVVLRVVSELGHYLDPISVYKHLVYNKDSNEGIYELGDGFEDFCNRLPDNLIIEVRDEWNQPFQEEIQVTLLGTSSSVTIQGGLGRIEQPSVGTYNIQLPGNSSNHRRLAVHQGSRSEPSYSLTLRDGQLSAHIYLQTIDLQDWFVVEEFDHLYTTGNQAIPFTDGESYFRRIHELLSDSFDYVFFSNWRLDYDFDLLKIPASTPQNEYHDRLSTIGNMLSRQDRRQKVYGILWQQKSPGQDFVYDRELYVNDNAFVALNGGIDYQEILGYGWRRLIRVLQDTRGNVSPDVVLSHHQKTFIVRRQNDLVAFCGGLDLAFQRWDDLEHVRNSPNRLLPNPLTHPRSPGFSDNDRTPRRIPGTNNTPLQAWHDVHVEIVGPAATDIDTNFRQRWEDAPVNLMDDLIMRTLGQQIDLLNDRNESNRLFHKATLPAAALSPQPPQPGSSFVKIARTYNRATPPIYTMMQNIIHCIRRARRLIYIEDQYLTSIHLAEELKTRLRAVTELVAIIVTGERPDQPGAITRRNRFLDALGYNNDFGDRVGVYHLRNKSDSDRLDERSIYVHSKLVMVDDIWASISSCNLNNRSFTADTEIGAMIIDGELTLGRRKFAFDLRKRLWEQHFRRPLSPAELLDDLNAKLLWESAASDPNSQVIRLRTDTQGEKPDLPVPAIIADGIVDPWGAAGPGVPDPDNPGQYFPKR